jgi:spermidine/putrescine transport system ATP-binding protein
VSELTVDGIVKRYGDTAVVRDVSFVVPSGRFFSILGPSGCGKTTLLRMIAGFIQPDAGAIMIGGRTMADLAPNRRPVNMVFQNLALFPMMNVGENIAYGLRCRGERGSAVQGKVERILERVGLAGLTGRRVSELSGGQRQRVALARSLVLEPAVLLLDEPLGALDLKLREHMKLELKQLQQALGTTFVYITHDQSEALVMSDSVAIMNNGRFEQVGTPRDLYASPQTAFVAGFVGDANRLEGRVAGRSGEEVRVEIPAWGALTGRGGVSDGQAEIFVRPETLVLSRDENDTVHVPTRFPVRVESVLFDGSNSRLLLQHRDPARVGSLRAALPTVGALADICEGEELWLGIPVSAATCFQARTK